MRAFGCSFHCELSLRGLFFHAKVFIRVQAQQAGHCSLFRAAYINVGYRETLRRRQSCEAKQGYLGLEAWNARRKSRCSDSSGPYSSENSACPAPREYSYAHRQR